MGPRLKRLFPYFRKLHAWIFLGFYLTFAVLTLLALLPGSLSGHGDSMGRSITAAICAVSGPFTGAIARGLQSCCLAWSVRIAPYFAGVFAVGFLFQCLPLPFPPRIAGRVRIAMWCVGLLGWYLGILISLGHALG